MSPFLQRLRRVETVVIRITLSAFAIGLPIVATAENDEVAVIQKLRTAASALRAEGVKLSDADFESGKDIQPSARVAAAGPEFVAAWKEYRRCISIRTTFEPQPVRAPRTNAFVAANEYEQLIRQLVDGEKPLTPEQLSRFYYADPKSFCGNTSDPFYALNSRAVLLACLRYRRFGEAAKMALEISGEHKVREDILTALGFDWRKVLAGAWLDGSNEALRRVCQYSDDETAQLLLRWAQLHWDEVVAKRGGDRRTGVYYPGNEPQLPSSELLSLLNPGNALTDPAKERVATFLNANATRLYDLDIWIYHLSRSPKGTASWLKPLLRAGLQQEKNEVRGLSVRMLHEAGEPDAKAELRVPPRFRLFVNGKAWPEFVTGLLRPGQPGGFRPDLGLSVKYFSTGGYSGSASSPGSNREGVIEPNADEFIPPDRVRRAYFYSFPMSIHAESENPDIPWIRAEIPLPPAFGATTDIRVDTVAVTIQPRFPRPLEEYKDKVTWVEFGFHGDEPGAPVLGKYRLKGSGPLVLARVQPGEYVVSVRAPGTARTPLQNVSVSPTAARIEPKLAIGATVVVPLAWGGGLDINALGSELGELFLRTTWARDSALIRVERNGTAFTNLDDIFPIDKQASKVTLLNLPVGKYVVRLQSSDDLRTEGNQNSGEDGIHAGWKKAQVSFEVTARSPAEFTAPPLRVDPAH